MWLLKDEMTNIGVVSPLAESSRSNFACGDSEKLRSKSACGVFAIPLEDCLNVGRTVIQFRS